VSNILRYIPNATLEAYSNIDEFVSYARHNYMSVIGLDENDFESTIWSIDLKVLGAKRTKTSHLKFSKIEIAVPRGNDVELPSTTLIEDSFQKFIKAIFLHRLVVDPTQAVSELSIVLRSIEFAIRKRLKEEASPCHLINDDMHVAAAMFSKEAESSAYRRALMLLSFIEIINEYKLTTKKIRWTNPFSKPVDMRMAMSAEAEERRRLKMPSMRSLHVILQMAFWALEGVLDKNIPLVEKSPDRRDVAVDLNKANESFSPRILGVALSVLGLNCRVSELVHMPCNPESFTLSKGELDSNGVAEDEDRFALKWFPIKGGNPMVKPFAKDLAAFVELIIDKLKSLSEGPRALARYYEKNPKRLYLPNDLEYLRNKEWLTSEEVSSIIGVLPRGVLSWAKNNKINTSEVPAKQPGKYKFVFCFKSIENFIISLLPSGFPYLDGELKYSDAIFLAYYKQSAYNYRTCFVMIDYFDQQVFEKSIGIKQSEPDHKTIFEYFGFYEESGSFIDLDTHEFRHLWQTLLKHAGVSEKLSAYAAGRRDVNQNKYYDLSSPIDAANLSFSIIDKTKAGEFKYSALAVAHEILSLNIDVESLGVESIVSFSNKSIVTFKNDDSAFNVQGCHMTSYGICRHNYVSSGCPKFKQCLECDELYCIKGIKAFETNARVKAEELRKNLTEYKKYLLEDQGDEIEGADNWLILTNRQLAKLDSLINSFFENDAVPIGTMVQVSPEMISTTALANTLVERLGEIIIRRPIGLG